MLCILATRFNALIADSPSKLSLITYTCNLQLAFMFLKVPVKIPNTFSEVFAGPFSALEGFRNLVSVNV